MEGLTDMKSEIQEASGKAHPHSFKLSEILSSFFDGSVISDAATEYVLILRECEILRVQAASEEEKLASNPVYALKVCMRKLSTLAPESSEFEELLPLKEKLKKQLGCSDSCCELLHSRDQIAGDSENADSRKCRSVVESWFCPGKRNLIRILLRA